MPEDVIGQSAPVGGDTSTPATQSAPQTAPAPSPTTGAAQAPAQGAPEDRNAAPSWLPQRLRESREAGQREAQRQFAEKEAAYQAQLNQVQNQLRALVGATPPANPEIDAVRQQFGSLYPGLSKIEERAQDILGILERAGDLESQNAHYWQSYGRQTMDKLFSHAAESLGQPLTEEGKRAIHSSFVGYVQSSPELTERYSNDPSIVEDFWKAFTSAFIDPVRRASTTAAVGRTQMALPQDTPAGVPSPLAPPKPGSLDERAANAWQTFNAAKTR